MSDNIEFGTETYGGMTGSEAIASQDTAANNSLLSGDGCTNGDCQNRSNPAEEAWVKLVSAIPVAGQIQSFKCVAGGVAAPSQEEVQSMVSQIRPFDSDKYALEEISEHWRAFNYDFSSNEGTAVEPILRSKLQELSNGWQGNDFDAFAEQMEAVFANCAQIAADIGDEASGMVGLLKQKADEIYNLQGGASGELPYPAPQYWTEDKGNLFTDTKIHVRPPFHSGECEIQDGCAWDNEDDGIKGAMELGGFDGEYANELNQYVTDQTEYHYTRLKAEKVGAVDTTGMDASEKTEATTLTASEEASLRAQAERLAQQDANERAEQDYDAGSQDYEARAQEQNDTVTARWQDAETSTSEFTPSVQPSGDTAFRESAGDLDSASYTPPGGGDFNGSPSSSGTSAMIPPESTTSFGGGPTIPGGNGSGFESSNGLDDANPWETGGSDDDETSGGLASGGGGLSSGTLTGTGAGTGLGTGGGLGGGSGAALGAGSGLFGPAVGGSSPGGMGRGAGAGGAGRGQGLFGKAAGGGPGGKGAGAAGRAGAGGMMGGRPGGAVGEDDEQNTGTWLTEDEDVWGLARFNDENDPLA
jgi:hypothetical protein